MNNDMSAEVHAPVRTVPDFVTADFAASLLEAVPFLMVDGRAIVGHSAALEAELGMEIRALSGPLDELGARLNDATFDQLLDGTAEVRLRLGPQLADRPVRLRRLGANGATSWIEVRSLAHELRLESLLRRSGMGHMLLTPAIELLWSMSSNDLSELFPGDNPLGWVELMDPDDMQTLGKAIYKVGQDASLRKTVSHRLTGDRTYTIIDTVESAIHDPDLRAVLVRSRPQHLDALGTIDASPFAGLTVSDNMPIGVVVSSVHGKVLHRNASAAHLIGARTGQSVVADGTPGWLLSSLDDEHRTSFRAAFDEAIAGRAAHCTVPSPGSGQRWLRVSFSPATASTIVLTIEDTTELVEAERKLRYLATHDALTALADRSAVMAKLSSIFSDQPLTGVRAALIFCDVDNFKEINDRFGHSTGDHVLIEIASRLTKAARSCDLVGRFGGDEFVIVLPSVDDQHCARALARHLFDNTVGAMEFRNHRVDVTLSMGVSITDETCSTSSELLRRADVAMYRSKRAGRSRISLYDNDQMLSSATTTAT